MLQLVGKEIPRKIAAMLGTSADTSLKGYRYQLVARLSHYMAVVAVEAVAVAFDDNPISSLKAEHHRTLTQPQSPNSAAAQGM